MDREQRFKQECIELYSELKLETLLDKIAAKICKYLDCREASIFIYDALKEELFVQIATGESQDVLKKMVLKKGEGIVGWVAEHNQGVIVNNCAKDPRFSASTDKVTGFVTQSLVAVPVFREAKLLGVLESINKISGKFSESDRLFMVAIAHFISIPLQNAILFNQVMSETRDKEHLIELGKIVSHSFSLDEVFGTLKTIISNIIVPLEVNVMVKSQQRTYRLVHNEKGPYQDKDFAETAIDGRQVVFPLRADKDVLGYLEIKTQKKMPAEVVALIRGIAIFAAISIEKYEMHSRILEKEKLESELEIARKIQQSFLLNKKIVIPGLDISFINIPSSLVGGDYYDILMLNPEETIFTINDISGHGIPASLIMAIFRANFTYRIKKDNHMLTTISHLNDLIAETTEINHFVTSFSCCINRKKLICRYINAGHNPPLLLRQDTILEMDQGETVLGVFPHVPRHEEEVVLEQGDILLLYTDGVIEAENRQHCQFSVARLKSFLRECKARSWDAETVKDQLIQHLKKYVDKDQFEDDVTFIVVRVVGG